MKKLLHIGILMVLLSVLIGCRTQYVPVETVRTEYRHTTDTVRQTDSIIKERETIIREADSTQLASLGIQLRQNERAILVLRKELERERSQRQEHRVDTVVRVDSIQVPYPVERKLSTMERLKLEGRGFLLAILLFTVLVVCYIIIRKYPQKLWSK